ncbi:MAG: DUF3857 domain-containing protein [Kaistella sp.]|nr:DUF3857 domain-containing protein [Kaistella sp.]
MYNKEQASNYLNKEVYVYESDGGARQVLASLKANTFNIENGTVINTKIDKESKYRSKEDKNYTITKFAYPNVKNGSVLEYSYTLTSPSEFLMSIPSFTIEDEIPISYVEYVFDVPDVLGYNINYSGSLVPKYRDVSAKNIYGGNYKVYRFGYRDVPAYKTEEFVMNNDNYKTSIRSELNSTNFDNQFKSYSLSWEDIRKRLYDSEYFGDQLKKTDLVKDLLPENVKAIASKVKRAEAILAFVQENFSWNNELALFTDKGIKNILSTKTGNSAEINLLLCMLMRHTGLDANPVVLATPAKGLLLSYSPSMSQLNYVITSLETDGKIYIFDGTSKLSKINMIPPRALNYNGVEMGQKETKILNIFYPDKSQTFLTVDAKLNPDGTFQGKFSDTDTKMFAMLVNERYLENKDEYLKDYKDQYKFSLTNIKSGLLNNENFETSMDFTSDTFVDNLGSKLVFNPLLFLYSQKHSFNQTGPRKAPIELITGFDRIKKVTITLPEGYVFENVPKSKKIRTEDSSILYQYIVSLKGNQLIVETTTTVADSVYPKEYYPAFTQIFDNITKIEGQLVTAVKK